MNKNIAGVTVIVGALAGLAITACSPQGTATAGPSHSSPPANNNSASPASTVSPDPANTPVPTASPSPTTAAALPGVVAECTNPPPLTLSERPAAIVVACADNGEGVEHMTWSGWTASGATGHGSLWLKSCKPSCAAGGFDHFPVSVTLSNVKSSPHGRYFGTLTISFSSHRPQGTLPTSYGLLPPQA